MFCDNFRKYRIEKGYSQRDIAEKLYVTRQCVSKWEKGITQPDLQTLAQISELLGVSVDALIKENDGLKDKDSNNDNLYLFIANILIAIFCMIAFIVIWRFMPKSIPAHWTHGSVDRYGSRNEIFINIITVAVFWAIDIMIFFVLRHVKDKKIIYLSHITIVLFQIAYLVFIIVLYAEYIVDIYSFITCLSVDLIMCLSVAMHPKINKRNYLLGIRTAETLRSPTVWHKTNALGCYLFAGCSLVIFVINMSVIFDLSYLCLSAYLIPTIIVIVYSKMCAH